MRIAVAISVLFGLLSLSLFAAEVSNPVGKWKTIDDKTGKQKSVVELYEENGELKGKILKVIPSEPEGDAHPKCDKCTGELKDKPVVGMVFLWGLKKEGNEYTGGNILDPKNGTIYKAKLAIDESGEKIKVRGFIGFSFIGRTQIWLREQ